MSHDQDYDIAVSFAGEQREYVERAVEAAKKAGLRVFYDRDMTVEWWGKNFVAEQRKVYGSRTRYFVPFISTEYLAKPHPRDEFDAAMLTAVKQGDGYILPVLMGDVVVPAELLHPHVAYLKSDDYTPDGLAEVLRRKVAGSGQEPREVSSVVRSALKLPIPRVPRDFDKYEEAQSVFRYLLSQFRSAAAQLEVAGYPTQVEESEHRFDFSVERWGRTIYRLGVIDQSAGGIIAHLDLVTLEGYSRTESTMVAFFDVEAGQPKLKVTGDPFPVRPMRKAWPLTKEEVFHELWSHIVHRLEQA